MRLQRLTALEREKLDLEYEELTEKIGYFRSILTEEEKLLGVIKDEILEIKEKYSDKRRTKISQEITEFNIEDLIEDEEVVITFTQRGYIKRLPLDTYKSQHRGGRGIIGVTTEKILQPIYLLLQHIIIYYFSRIKVDYTELKHMRFPKGREHLKEFQ